VAWVTVTGPDNYDLNDLMIDSGVEAVKDFIDDKVLRFHDLNAPDVTKAFIRSGRDILADTTVVNCLLEDIIPVGSFGVIVGETGAGKSFFALALALCLTSGMSFYGRSVQQGGSLYVAAEGNRGYRRRMKAWLVKNRFAEVPEGFFMTTGAVDLLDVEAMRETALFCKENDVTSVFFDTFHRCFSGEENSARDVGTALQNIGKYFSELGIAVILIHHSGLSTTSRGRGSSALKSGADFELIIEKCDGGLRLNPSKIKDGELFPAESFILVPQGTGLFDHKGEITSLVLEKGEARRTAQLSRKDSKLWSALQQLGESFTREEAEDCTFSMIDAKNKGQTLTRLLTRLETFEAINYSDDNYLILK
jgi:RecA-family ATPase